MAKSPDIKPIASTPEIQAFLEDSFEFWDKLYHIAVQYLGDYAAAEDAVQDILIKAAHKQKQFQGRSALYTWLVRILINHCHDIHRKLKRRKTSSLQVQIAENKELENEIVDERQDIEKKIERGEVSDRLIDMLRELKPIYKEVVILRYFEELSYANIAATLAISEGTVKSRLNSARRVLKSELSSHGIGEEYLAL